MYIAIRFVTVRYTLPRDCLNNMKLLVTTMWKVIQDI